VPISTLLDGRIQLPLLRDGAVLARRSAVLALAQPKLDLLD
jgi:hypothetical protein